MKYALIGCGRIAPNHIRAAKEHGLEICALCDVLPEAAEEIKSIFGLETARVYTDYKEMILREKPELIAIATISGMHAEIALFAIEAGCNVIIEKPIAMSMSDARKIVAAAKEKGVKVCANHQNRFNKPIQKIKNAIDEGKFGRILHGSASILWHRDKAYFDQAAWRGTWKDDGGTLMNQCIHDIDLLRWLMGGDIDEIVAYTDNVNHPYIEAEDIGVALVRFSNGSYGIIEGTTNASVTDLEETLFIFGEKGTAKAGGLSCNQLDAFNFEGDTPEDLKKNTETPPNVYGFGHAYIYADMIDAIKNDREPYVTAEDGMKALEVVLAIYLSAAEHRPVRLPLGDVSTIDFYGRFGEGKR